MITKDLGMVTAYAYAVSKGYTGTETQFAELMASYASVAQEAVNAALAAAQSAQDAESAKDTAQTTVSGAIAGIQAEGQTQIGAVQSEGTTQVGNVNSAGTTQVDAVQAKGAEVLDSIPSDYTALSGEVSGLKSALGVFNLQSNAILAKDADKTINTAAQVVNSTNTDIYIAEVFPTKTILVESSPNCVYAFFDKYPEYGVVGIGGRENLQSGVNEITIPSNVSYIAVLDIKNHTPDIVFKDSIQDRLNKAEQDIDYLSDSPINGGRIIDHTISNEALSELTHYEYSNYIDKNKIIVDAYIGADGNIYNGATNFFATDKIYLSANKTYYAYNLYLGYLAFYSADGTVIAGYGSSSSPFVLFDSGHSIYSFATPANTSYARFTTRGSDRAESCWIYSAPEKPEDYASYLPIYAEKAVHEPKPTDYDGNEICIFRNCLCIGDSFTEGGFNADAHDPDMDTGFADYSYPTNLARMVGFNVTNMGHGGESAQSWNRTYTSTIGTGYDMCIILLGINDCINYGSFTQESCAALGNIIAKVEEQNNHIKIFVCTIPLSPSYRTPAIIASAQIIKDYVASLDDENLYILDLAEYGHLGDSMAYTYGHPTAYGYHVLADDIRRYVSYIIDRNKMDFKFIQFIGTNMTHDTPI